MLDRLLAQLASQPPRESSEAERAFAAVALVLADGPDRLLLIRRAERADDPWSGHLALPGGRRQETDVDLLTTAVRETREETGIHLEADWCGAQLDDLVPLTLVLPAIIVRPFVFHVPAALPPGVSSEVVHSTWLPLAHLVADGVRRTVPMTIRGESRMIEGYQLPEGFLWGMTERIISPVLRVWRELGGGAA